MKVTMDEAVQQYADYQKARQLKPNTIKNTKYLLARASRVWGNIYLHSVGPRHVDRLFTDGDWSPRTQNTNLQTLRQFFAWARNLGYMPLNSDPTFGWRNQRVPQRDKLRIPVDEFGSLLDAAEHPRDRAIIAIGLFLFLRGSEVAHLRVGDVDFKQNAVQIFRVKTQQEDTLPMCLELHEELTRYLNFYRKQQGGLRPEWFLVPARQRAVTNHVRSPWDGRFTSASTILVPNRPLTHTYVPAQRALARLGYPTKGEGEHTLRRSGARAYVDQLRSEGFDNALLRVASMLGHSDIKITQHYIGLNVERAQRNEALAGKRMLPDMAQTGGQVIRMVGR